jgi:hypothetical protein
VTAIDPQAPPGHLFQPVKLEEFSDTGPFDYVVSSLALHHIADLKGAVDRIAGLLVREGALRSYGRTSYVGVAATDLELTMQTALIRPRRTGASAENAAATIEVMSGIRCPSCASPPLVGQECDELSRLRTA